MKFLFLICLKNFTLIYSYLSIVLKDACKYCTINNYSYVYIYLSEKSIFRLERSMDCFRQRCYVFFQLSVSFLCNIFSRIFKILELSSSLNLTNYEILLKYFLSKLVIQLIYLKYKLCVRK